MPCCSASYSNVMEHRKRQTQEPEVTELEQNNVIYCEGQAAEYKNVEIQSQLSEDEMSFAKMSPAPTPTLRGRTDLVTNKNKSITTQSSAAKTTSFTSQKTTLPKAERIQKEIDNYYLNKGLNYYEDFCTCALDCVIIQVCRDKFLRSTITSLALFLAGIKLCFELDAWTIPASFF